MSLPERKRCMDCLYNEDNPCKPCYENEHIFGWHFYWKSKEYNTEEL